MFLKKKLFSFFSVLFTFLLLILPISGCSITYQSADSDTSTYTADSGTADDSDTSDSDVSSDQTAIDETDALLDQNGSYTSKEDVTNYLVQYGTLPKNFITKKAARKLGWEGGSLEPYAPGKCIGGDYFGNYEQKLPVVSGRTYHECDIDTLGADSRGAKRIIYSDDGQIYYTDNHYQSFTLLYGDDSQ